VAGFTIVAAVSEEAWRALTQEDGVVEWGTVVAYLLSAWLLLGRLRVAWRSSRLLWVGLLSLGAFCLFVAGEEISWGQRLFAFRPPDVFLERNFQQEFNVHNLLLDERNLGFSLPSRHLVVVIALLYGVVGPWLTRLRALSPAASVFPPLALGPVFVIVGILGVWYPVRLAGEGAELLLGMGFLAGQLVLMSWRRALGWLVMPLVLGAVLGPVFARVAYGDDASGTATAREELALLAQDIQREGAGELARIDGVHKRLFTAVNGGYLDLDGGAFLEGMASPASELSILETRRDRRGYFLDPWNNPYWVQSIREGQRVNILLYSFGPNRLRDVDTMEDDGDAGDDVRLRLPLQGAVAP
jgi:hypothetical protein